MDVSITARQDAVWVLESPQYGIEGEIYVFTLTVPYASTISSPDTYCYRDGNDVTSSVGLDSAASASGNVLTSAAMTPTADVAGKYVVVFKFVNGSNTELKKLLLKIGKQEDAP